MLTKWHHGCGDITLSILTNRTRRFWTVNEGCLLQKVFHWSLYIKKNDLGIKVLLCRHGYRVRTSQFYSAVRADVNSTYRTDYVFEAVPQKISFPFGSASGDRKNNPHPHNLVQAFPHPSKVCTRSCSMLYSA